jgi:hypothetical protein
VLTYRSDAERTRMSSTRRLSILSAPMPMPALEAHGESARVTPPRISPAHTTQAHLGQLTMTAGWRAGATHVRATGTATTVAVKQVQGGRISGCDVIDNAFSTRMGPPSCSPPV